MGYSLEFYPALADEIEELKLYHELKRKGYGQKFYAELMERLELIVSNPHAFAIVSGNVRVARLENFSYLIRYRILGNRVRVMSIIHAARIKGRWRFRR